MDKEELLKSLNELLPILDGLWELHWFYNIGGIVDYSKPESKMFVKEKVEQTIGGLSILYLIAIFESHFKKDYWEKYMKPEDLKILKAYRYIRHCVAHGYGGKRITPITPGNQKEFDTFDEAIVKDLFQPKGLIELNKTGEIISIKPAIGLELKKILMKITQHAIAMVYNDIRK